MSLDPSKTPLASPPPGSIPNFGNPESRCWQIHLTAALCLSLASLFVLLRAYSKVFVTKKLTIDDYVMLFAYVCFIAYCGLIIAVFRKGYGRHVWELTLTSITNHSQLLLLISIGFYGPTLSIIKLALFLLIYQIFKAFRWLRYLVYFGAISNLLFYFSGSVYQIVVCSPWHGLNYIEVARTPRCARTATYGEVQGVVNILGDFYLLIMPIPAVWALQMPKRRRLGIIAIFMTGLLACIASCIGLWIRVRLRNASDITWEAVNPVLVAMIEMAIGIVVGCTPAVAAVFRKQYRTFAKISEYVRSKLDFSWLSSVSQSKEEVVSSRRSRSQTPMWGNKSYIELTTKGTSSEGRKEPKRSLEDVTLSRW